MFIIFYVFRVLTPAIAILFVIYIYIYIWDKNKIRIQFWMINESKAITIFLTKCLEFIFYLKEKKVFDIY